LIILDYQQWHTYNGLKIVSDDSVKPADALLLKSTVNQALLLTKAVKSQRDKSKTMRPYTVTTLRAKKCMTLNLIS
jgi:hypothetical protein